MGHESGRKLLLGTSYRWRKHHAWNQVESHAFKLEIVRETACFQARCKWDQEFYHWIVNISFAQRKGWKQLALKNDNFPFHSSYFSLSIPNPSALNVLQWETVWYPHPKSSIQLLLFSLGLLYHYHSSMSNRCLYSNSRVLFLNWIVLRQYHFVWICSLTPLTLTLSRHPSSDLLYP